MQPSSWLALFKRMPQSQHDNMSLVTSIGVEVALQQIIRLERDFMVVRGRLTGTMDTGVVIMLPYDQITYMNFIKRMPDEEVNELFKNFQAPPAAPAAVSYQPVPNAQAAPVDDFRPVEFSAKSEKAAQPAEQEVSEEVPGEPGKPAAKGKPISKTMMLARLRARLAAEKGPVPPG